MCLCLGHLLIVTIHFYVRVKGGQRAMGRRQQHTRNTLAQAVKAIAQLDLNAARICIYIYNDIFIYIYIYIYCVYVYIYIYILYIYI